MERWFSSGDPSKDEALLTTFEQRMRQWGMGDRILLYSQTADGPVEFRGMGAASAEVLLRSADLLLNFNYRIDPALMALFKRTALIDIDPGLLQFWMDNGQLRLTRHHAYFTTGETVGASPLIPHCGIDWVYTRPPICLDLWTYCADAGSNVFTTVSSWWGGHGRGEWVTDGDSQVYENNKRVTFLQFLELPRASGEKLELALAMGDGDPVESKLLAPPKWTPKRECSPDISDYKGDAVDRAALERPGWRVRMAAEAAGTPEQYQRYVRGSRGEFSSAKPSCMRLKNAWVSDRSLSYLASGRPVVVQDTGPSAILPRNEGMFRFSTMEEAVEAFASIRAGYARQSRAARELAESYFDAKVGLQKVLNHALDTAPRVAPPLKPAPGPGIAAGSAPDPVHGL
jgi:hypothetical protein